MTNIKLKICGMREPKNIKEVGEYRPDFMGFIFYEPSSRYVNPIDLEPSLSELGAAIKRVGVFVNETPENIIDIGMKLNLDFIQLHGNETVAEAEQIKSAGFDVIKAFHIYEKFDWKTVTKFKDVCEYFLFDTAGDLYGGNGYTFDWDLLGLYQQSVPFLLSGGLDENVVSAVRDFNHPQFQGIDLNSRVELYPGKKDVNKIAKISNELTHEY